MRQLSNFFANLMRRYVPNAYIFVVILTFIVFIGALFVTNSKGESNGVLDIVNYWGGGFWNLLAFAMQMALIVATGQALAFSKPVKKLLDAIANTLNTPTKAIIGIAIISPIVNWLNYGLGLVVGGLLAIKIASKVKEGLHYPLLVAMGYAGFIVWHGGLSASIPLTAATGSDKIVTSALGAGAAIPITDTIFSPLNLLISASFLIILPVMGYLMMPKKEDIIELDPEIAAKLAAEDVEAPAPDRSTMTPAVKLENSVILTALTVLLGGSYIVMTIAAKGSAAININMVIFIILIVGIGLHKTPINYVNAFTNSVRDTAGILLQFPMYGGIMGIMIASGLATAMTNVIVGIASVKTLPVLTFLIAGVVNFFVPSGGGQWAVMGNIVLDTASQMGASIPGAVLAIAWGDAWTNMIQPFWALPLIGIAKLEVRDILGYTTPILLVSGVVISLFLYFGV